MVLDMFYARCNSFLYCYIYLILAMSVEKNSTVIRIIRADVLPRFAEFLSRHGLPQLQMEAAWVLTNIAASDYTLLVAECGAVPRLVELLRSPNANIRHQVKPILEIVSQLIHSADEKILADACWTVYCICGGVDDAIQDVLDAGVCPQLVNLLMHASASVLLPVIMALARISAGDDAQVQAVIDASIISPLVVLLKTSESDIKKEAAWALSNAASSASSEQIQYLVSRGCLEPLCSVLSCKDHDLVYTCLEGLENILQAGEAGKKGEESGTNPYAQFILECGGLDKLEDLQDVNSDRIYELAMKLLQSYWEEEVSGSDDPDVPGSNDSADTVETKPEDAAQPPEPASGADDAE
ncbi:hypothetical protein C2845_PM04G34440 [Panicum miliaceum]|uniref:Importin subunit alpha n=1 Tax=Panicum miliaceum TaxID=4540 RepID=A0A3L6QL64_PANMI|nr:hypothetical protein C2845_PM04G34440 [Panicum miliaceum]